MQAAMEMRSSWIWKCLIVLMLLRGGESFVGINWGRYATQELVATTAVDLMLQNGFSEIRMFAPRPSALAALEGSSAGVTVTLSRDFLFRDKFISNLQNVSDWVAQLIAPPIQRSKINITTVIVTQQPFLDPKITFPLNRIVWNLSDIFRDTRMALDEHNLTYVRTTTSHFIDVLNTAGKPSEADFRDDIKGMMLEHLEQLNKTNSFFTYDIYPITALKMYKWPVEFGFMDNKSNFTVVDGKYTYTNAFEFLYDSLVVALEKAGYPDMEIVVGQIGWPTDGSSDATPKNAERFYKGFLPHIVNRKGTPRRRNTNIDIYVFSLSDENKMSFPNHGPYIRHWGIYEYDGTPKFEIDFSGKGRKIIPPPAGGVMKLPLRWCVFTGNTSNRAQVELAWQTACNSTDCSSLEPGGSCSKLNYTSRVSYAFNAFYQALSQKEEMPIKSCSYFGDLSAITMVDPSEGDCKFPVEILTAETVDGGKQIYYTVDYDRDTGAASSAARFNLSLPLSIALPLLLFFLAFITSN